MRESLLTERRGTRQALDPGGAQFKLSKFYGITDEDMALGLRHVKALVRARYRKLAKQYHPDAKIRSGRRSKRARLTGSTFSELAKKKKYVEGLQVMPLTLDNLEAVLEVTKGYVSTRDVELPWE